VIAEAGRSIDSPDAQDYILRGRAALTKPISLKPMQRPEPVRARAIARSSRA
jgi:hypothetical protein